MNAEDKQKLIERYNVQLKNFGYAPESLGWGPNKEKQLLRFQALTEIGFESGDSVLDVGCGFADLFGFLQHSGMKDIAYKGIDINPELINMAKEVYPDADVAVADILTEGLDRKYDWIVASGTFNAKLHNEDNFEFIKNMLSCFYENCNKGIAADFLSTFVDYQNELAYHTDYTMLLPFLKKLNWKTVLRFDVLPYEFTAYCYK